MNHLRRTRRLLTVGLLSSLVPTGCANEGDAEVTVLYANPSDKEDTKANSLLLNQQALATDMGLVTFDANALVRPGIAERWVISEDGMSYIFRIGDHRWPDGKPVTANDIAVLMRKRLRALKGQPLAAEAEAITQVIARTEEILELQLDAPRPRLLDLLASPSLSLARNGTGLGPMQRISTGPEGTRFAFLQSDDSGTVAEGKAEIIARGVEPAKAITEYNIGETDIVLGMGYDSVPLLTAANIAGDEIVKDPVMGHFGFEILNAEGALASSFLREAIAMGIDRPRLLSAFGVSDWHEMIVLSPTKLSDRLELEPPPWTLLDAAERKQRASERLAQAGLRGTELRLFIEDSGPGATLLFGLMRQQFSGIGLVLLPAPSAAEADLRLVDEVADFDDPLWYLTRLGCDRQPICDEQADEMVAEARTLESLPDRILLLAEAEARLTAVNSYIPIAEPLRLFLRRRPMDGLQPNFRGLHLLQYIAPGPDQ